MGKGNKIKKHTAIITFHTVTFEMIGANELDLKMAMLKVLNEYMQYISN